MRLSKKHLSSGLGLCLALTPFPSFAEDGPALDPTQILVDLVDDTTDADEVSVEAKLGLDLRLNSIHAAEERFFIADVDAASLPALIERLRGDPRVEFVEPNYIYEARMVPNDPLFAKQWSFQMISAPDAWDHATGRGITVAVIDTGVAFEDHKDYRLVEDLRGAEFVDGYDFVKDDDHANDDHGHGTHVAGTIAQRTNNGIGVAGIAYDAKIMPLKVLNRAGRGTAADIADAIRYAADEGAQIINMSLGGGPRSFVMESAVNYARKKGVLVVCAAGNGGRGVVEYPAAYPGAFAVSSVGPDRTLAYYSSYGKEVAVAAPGGDKNKGGDGSAVLQNTITPNEVGRTNLYLSFQGTSMATPHVAGIAALIMSAGVTDVAEVERILRETATDAGPAGHDPRYGAGIVHAGRAVKAARAETGGLASLSAGLALWLGFVVRAVRRRGLRPGALGLVGTVLASSGLFFLDRLGLGNLGAFSRPLPEWDLFFFGPSGHATALWFSVLPVLILSVVLLNVRRLQGLVVGLALGFAAHFAVHALFMPADIRWIPGLASGLDRVWLFANALMLIGLARILTQPRTR